MINTTNVTEGVGTFSGAQGIQLYWHGYFPRQSNPKAAVVVMHGGNNYCDMDAFHALAFKLVSSGFCVYGYDQRGYGRSGGERMHIDKWEDLRGDMNAFLRFVRMRETGLKVFAAGISFGALQAFDQALVAPHMLDGVILMSLSSSLNFPIPLKMAAHIAGSIAPKSKLKAQPHETFIGAKELYGKADLWRDPLCPTTMTFGMLRRLLKRHARIVRELEWLKLPVMHMQGANDTIAPRDEALLELCGSKDKTYRIYDDVGHDMLDYPEVFVDIVKWLTRRAESTK